jgi:hypothetical protein
VCQAQMLIHRRGRGSELIENVQNFNISSDFNKQTKASRLQGIRDRQKDQQSICAANIRDVQEPQESPTPLCTTTNDPAEVS